MNQRTHQAWTEDDRQQLRRLCVEGNHDYQIAAIMKRSATAVSWQRRKWRIRMAEGVNGCAAWRSGQHAPRRYEPKKPPRNIVDFGENPARIAQLMALVSRK